MPLLQSMGFPRPEAGDAAALAAAISLALKGGEIDFSLLAIGIAAGNQVRSVVTSRSPDQEDHTPKAHAKALQPELTVGFAVIFHCDHVAIKHRFQVCKINLVFPEIPTAFRLIPCDHEQTVDAK
jgi:hypothetical protein